MGKRTNYGMESYGTVQMEFDCFLHLECLEKQSNENPEVLIMRREFGLKKG